MGPAAPKGSQRKCNVLLAVLCFLGGVARVARADAAADGVLPVTPNGPPTSAPEGTFNAGDYIVEVWLLDFEGLEEVPENDSSYGRVVRPTELLLTEILFKLNAQLSQEQITLGRQAFYADVDSKIPLYLTDFIPPTEARVLTFEDSVTTIRGHPRADYGYVGEDNRTEWRIASIWDPFRTGVRFQVTNPASTATLYIDHVTIWLPNATFGDVLQQRSGLEAFVSLPPGGQYCISNTAFVLQDCSDFDDSTVTKKILCCNQASCSWRDPPFKLTVWGIERACEVFTPTPGVTADVAADTGESFPLGIVLAAVITPTALLVVTLSLWHCRRTHVLQPWRGCSGSGAIKSADDRRSASKSEAIVALNSSGRESGGRADAYLMMSGTSSGRSRQSPPGNAQWTTLFDTGARDLDAPLSGGASPSLLPPPGAPEQRGSFVDRAVRAELAVDDEQSVTVEDEIGRGAFGVVYRGRWKGLRVAIKRLLLQLPTSEGLTSDPVIREAKLALQVSDANVVNTYQASARQLQSSHTISFSGGGAEPTGLGAFRVQGSVGYSYELFIIQEFCDGGSLHAMLKKGKLHPGGKPDQGAVARCAMDVAKGTQALHRNGIVHGDLKPDNVLLSSAVEDADKLPANYQYIAKLCDFGLSFKMEQRSHLSQKRVGTPFYLSPEVSESGLLSKAADIYSFGVILWELFFNMRPYRVAADGRLHMREEFPSFVQKNKAPAPPTYMLLTLACLAPDRELRPSIELVVAILRDLNDALNPSDRHADALAALTAFEQGLQRASTEGEASTQEAPPQWVHDLLGITETIRERASVGAVLRGTSHGQDSRGPTTADPFSRAGTSQLSLGSVGGPTHSASGGLHPTSYQGSLEAAISSIFQYG